jgi:hypothetical protein
MIGSKTMSGCRFPRDTAASFAHFVVKAKVAREI